MECQWQKFTFDTIKCGVEGEVLQIFILIYISLIEHSYLQRMPIHIIGSLLGPCHGSILLTMHIKNTFSEDPVIAA